MGVDADEFRRTFKFEGARRKDLETIREKTRATTDTAAVDDAIRFRARYAGEDPRRIDLGLWLLTQLDDVATDGVRTVTVKAPSKADGQVTEIRLPVPALR